MTERWISTKKHYCKYCNTWIPDTKISRQQHDISDRHKNAMQRNLSRIQRQDLINRHSNPSAAPPPKATAASGTSMRKGVANTAAYGYGDRDDMAAYIAKGKKMKFDNIPSSNDVVLPKSVREANVGKWEVTQVISKEAEEDEKDEVKKEESPEPNDGEFPPLRTGTISDGGKRERAQTPDVDDLLRFRVQEKSFPTEVKEEGEDVKVPAVGFKKRKVGGKSQRVSMAL
jgi:U1 zinc finger